MSEYAKRRGKVGNYKTEKRVKVGEIWAGGEGRGGRGGRLL